MALRSLQALIESSTKNLPEAKGDQRLRPIKLNILKEIEFPQLLVHV
jgi:hypothetical protein